MGQERKISPYASASKRALMETGVTNVKGNDIVTSPVEYSLVFNEIDNSFGTDIKGVPISELAAIVLDYCVSHSETFTGASNGISNKAEKNLLKKTIKGKDELAYVFQSIVNKDINNTVLYKNSDQGMTTILDYVLNYYIDRNMILSREKPAEMTLGEKVTHRMNTLYRNKDFQETPVLTVEKVVKKTVEGISLARISCGLGDEINRREVAGMLYVTARLLTIFLKDEPVLMKVWINDVRKIEDGLTRQMFDSKTMFALYVLAAAASLEKERYPILTQLLSCNFNKDSEPKKTLFDAAADMTKYHHDISGMNSRRIVYSK